jgi:hypothetical protein
VSENSPADFVAVVALNLLDSTPTRRERATAELLQHLAGRLVYAASSVSDTAWG